jgi:hypothetical protein
MRRYMINPKGVRLPDPGGPTQMPAARGKLKGQAVKKKKKKRPAGRIHSIVIRG